MNIAPAVMRIALSPVTLEVHVGEGDPARPALVFLHYFGGSGKTWGTVADALTAEGFRCILPDLCGYGDSTAPGEHWMHYAVDIMADDIYELVGKLRLPRFVLVGHSMGGKIALALAARRPAGLEAVALLAPSPPTPEPMAAAERARLLASHGDRAAAEETLRKITARPLPGPLATLAVDDSLRASVPAWRAWLEHGSREDIAARLAHVGVPVAVAVGQKDDAITAALVEREINARLAHPQPVRVVPDAGHLLPLEAPAATVAFLRETLAQIVPFPEAIASNIEASTDKRDVGRAEEPHEFPAGAIPLTNGRPGTAEQVAELVLFLASAQRSGHITGTPLWIDGAESLLQG